MKNQLSSATQQARFLMLKKRKGRGLLYFPAYPDSKALVKPKL